MLKRSLLFQNVNIRVIHFENCLRKILTTSGLQKYSNSSQNEQTTTDNSNNDEQVFPNLKSKDMTYWTQHETDILKNAVLKHGNKWTYITKEYFQSNKKPETLCQKWKTIRLSESRPSYYNKWSTEENKLLIKGVEKYGVGNWTEISKLIRTKDSYQIQKKWKQVSKKKSGKWTKEEDRLLFKLIEEYGGKWNIISDFIDRPYNSCLMRYQTLSFKPWTPEENNKLRDAILKYDHDWDKIMKNFPDRTLNEIKKYYWNNPKANPHANTGRWKEEEIKKFWEAFEIYGKKWINVSKDVGTRTPKQCHMFFRTREYNKMNT
ncbi:15827_t:CDS:1 [Funneliformis caledonium]|uniref:15827_t:CDS:1 n=1 Tax=Funneliformis caledonium TaxID=1117310 RepID=A0A9N8ZVH5_9GLOM|nr:15827_t:CDS:1 [Funneliformis caledonium]